MARQKQSNQLAKRAILCLMAVSLAGYLLYWFFFALNQEHMGDIAEWGTEHGVLSWHSEEGAWVAPGLLWNPLDISNTVIISGS